MASKSQETIPHAADAKDHGDGATENQEEPSLSVDELKTGFDKSLDLKSSASYSSPIELNESSNLSVKQSEVPDKKETKRRHAAEAGATRNGNEAYLDLKLSPPGILQRGKAPIESKPSSPISQGSCVSVEVDSKANPENNLPDEGPPLIVMGCTFCLLYVMVTDADPRCPKCKKSGLLDLFRGNQSKRSRTN